MHQTFKGQPPRPADSKSKIYIVAEHRILGESLGLFVAGERGFAVCGHTGDADEALATAGRLQPDVVLIDIPPAGETWIELIKNLKATSQRLKVLAISARSKGSDADRVLRAGADGFILKQESADDLIDAIHDVLGGHIYISEQALASAPEAFPRRAAKSRISADMFSQCF